MAPEWFYQAKGQQRGPVASSELLRLADAGAIMPDTLVCMATATRTADGRWVRAEKVQGLFQRSAPARPPSPTSPPPLPPAVPPMPESGTPNRNISGESSIRNGLRATAAGDLPEKPERIWPATWAAIIVGSGTVLLLLWALVFRGDSARHQEAKSGKAAGQEEVAPQVHTDWVALADELLGPETAGPQVAPRTASDRAAKAGSTTDTELPAAEGKAKHRAVRAPEAKSPPVATANTALDLADLAELVGPPVVQVNVTGPETAGTGSGFVLDNQGTIVTNYHVIQDATEGTVVFSDKTSAPITGYLGAWPEKDIALVRVECPRDKLRPLRLATSSPRQGERVAAFGSPLGLAQSVSEGIVSAVRQSKELRTVVPIEVNALLIQTTTPISHGNSGGPLLDMKGMVVGVNTMTFQPLGGENLNFAVAAAEVPPLLWGKNKSPSPLPVDDAGQSTVNGVGRIVRRAWAHVIAGELDEAIAECSEAIRLNPKDATAYWTRGDAYTKKGDYDTAIADYTEAIRLDPQNALAYGGRAFAYKWKYDYDQAIADFTVVIRLDPKDATAYCGRGGAYREKRDYDQAIADYTEAIRLDPTNSLAYCSRGFVHAEKRDYDQAIADFTEAIRLDPEDPGAYQHRGDAYKEKRDYDQAIADHTQAIRLDPTNSLAYCSRGFVHAEKRDYDQAIADYTEAIRLGPTNSVAYWSRGDAYKEKRHYDQAIADYSEVIRLHTTWVEPYCSRGDAYRYTHDYDRAIADYSEAIRLKPTYAIAYNNRGVAYEGKGDYDRAIADYTEAIRLDPKNGDAYMNRGVNYGKRGDHDAAIADFTAAIRLDPKDALAYWNRSVAYRAEAKFSSAERDLARAKRLGYKP